MDRSALDVLTLPEGRTGPNALGLAVIGVLFLVPGLIAPLGVLQLVGAVWLVAAVVVGTIDVVRLRRLS